MFLFHFFDCPIAVLNFAGVSTHYLVVKRVGVNFNSQGDKMNPLQGMDAVFARLQVDVSSCPPAHGLK